MKKNHVVALGLLGAVAAAWTINGTGCASSPNSSASGGHTASGGSEAKGSGGSTGSGGSPGSGGSGNGSGGSGRGSGGSDSSCDIPSLAVFARSDTDQTWDDNDFDDVTLDGSCPVVATVTWPHEANWENADPSEANRESTHFTLDSYYSSDLTGKQLDLEIELTDDTRGSRATAGGYVVSLVSVSMYDMVVGSGGGTAGAGGTGAAGGAGGIGGSGGDGGEGPGGIAGSSNGGGRSGPGVGGRPGGAAGRQGRAGGGSGGALGGVGGAPTGAGGTVGDDGGTGGTSGTGSGGDDGGAASGGSSGNMTVTGYSEAETAVEDRVTLSKIGDKATMSFVLPGKTSAANSYDPARPVKINIRIYSVFSSSETTPSVYDYMTSKLTIKKFSVSDAK